MMQQQNDSFSPIQLTFQDRAVELRFLNQYRVKQLDRVQVGFGFLVLLFMAIASAQLILFHAPVLANLCNAGLGMAALTGFSLFNPHQVIHRPVWLRSVLAAGISLGAVAATFLPSVSMVLQVITATIALIWLAWFSGLSFRQTGIVMLAVLLPVIFMLSMLMRPLSPDQLAALTVLGLSAVFASLSSYLNERSARLDFQQQLRSAAGGRHGSVAIRQDQGLQALKELTIELSTTRDSDTAYGKLLSMIRRTVNFDLAAVGRLQNERIIPVMVRSNSSEAGCEDTIKLLWHNNLIMQLQKQRMPLSGPAEMGLLQSTVENGEITFGHRLDIPFFSQRKLDGVVTLLRSTPDFSSSESALVASMVFHGLFAKRSARLHQQLEKAMQSSRLAKPVSVPQKSSKRVLSVDAFLERATSAFQQAQSSGLPVSLILIEMEQHSDYLDRFGEKGVARIFEALGAVLSDNLPRDSLLGRYGSGSFALQLPVPFEQARQLAEKLRQVIGKHNLTVGSEKIDLSVNFGVSARDEAAPDFLSLLRGADIGLYLARGGEKADAARVDH